MSTRLHIVVSDELLACLDACLGPGQSRSDFVRRAVGAQTARMLPSSGPGERVVSGRGFVSPAAVERALGERPGGQTDAPVPAPAEQPGEAEQREESEVELLTTPEVRRRYDATMGRRSAREFRPYPKGGKG